MTTTKPSGIDYEPIDLSPWCNAGATELGSRVPAQWGAVTLCGLPFVLGGFARTPAKSLVVVDAQRPSVTVPVRRAARWVVFAHRQLARDRAGWSVGEVASRYRLHMADGSIVDAPVRERFEIQVIDADWGGLPGGAPPFVAVPDHDDGLYPRRGGPWDVAGLRQCESIQGWPEAFYLWAWRVPSPDIVIDSIQFVAAASPVAIAGVTLGRLDEEPFTRSPKREVKVTLTDPARADLPFDLSVGVDRGIASYAHALPADDADVFRRGPHRLTGFPGWGQVQNERSSPAYVEISASPSATVSVQQGDETIGTVRWGEVEKHGVAGDGGVRVQLLDRGRNWIHVTVLDDATGRPVPCRVHFRSPEGVPYQPHGHPNQLNSNLDTWHVDVGGDVRLGQITYAYIDGTCQGWLPRGDVVVDVARGFEYEPLRQTVRVERGQRELTLRLVRWANLAAEGWYSGDSHVHFLSTQGALFEQQGEDLNVVNLLQAQWGALFTNAEDFTGRTAIAGDGRYLTRVSQENRQHVLGHLVLWGLQRPVMPWSSDGPREAEIGGSLETTLSDWADQCHAQGGTVVIPHFPNPNGEPSTLIATGRADAVEMLRCDPDLHEEYYRYLNAGYRLPLVGGTDKMAGDVPVGMYRTYARVGPDEEFTHEAWSRAVRAGRTFLTSGPIVRFSVDGHDIGDTVPLPGPGTVEAHATVESTIPIHRLEIVQQGRVVAEVTDPSGARRLEVRAPIRVDGHSWLAARCGGPDGPRATFPRHLDGWHRGVFAHTSPIYLQCGRDEWRLFDANVARYMRALVQGSLAHIRHGSRQYPPGSVTHHHGQDDHLAYLEKPFHEALRAIDRRLSGS